jgi:DNA modification methylase
MGVRVLDGDVRSVLPTLPDGSVQCCVTSPPYFGLRDYGVDGQIGLEPTVDAYVAELVSVFREVRRVLRDDGTLWLNLGDSYAGSWGAHSRGHDAPGNLEGGSMLSARQIQAAPKGTKTGSIRGEGIKPKDLIGVPWMVAFALRADGWFLRSDIIWAKPNPMPESVRDRPTKAHEYLFLLTKNARYYWDADAVREEGKSESEARYANGYKSFGAGQFEGSPADRRTAKEIPAEKLAHLTGRNIRSVWTIATHAYPGSHFATFPPALVEPCIKAGTSEKGACPACGAPWVRVVEQQTRNGSWHQHENDAVTGNQKPSGQKLWDAYQPPKQLGWQPSCACDGTFVDEPYTLDEPERTWKRFVPGPDGVGDPVPCVVLDPFFGAGTVGLVADRLGRDAIGIELNPDYAAMARKRIAGDAPLFAAVS